MDDRMLEALRKSRLYLLENVEYDTLEPCLISEDIFSMFSISSIHAGQDRIAKVRRMLDHLNRRSKNDFHRFLKALRDSSQAHCAEEIEKNYVRSGPTQVSDPTPGPVYTVISSYPSVPVQLSNFTQSGYSTQSSYSCQSSYSSQVPSDPQDVEMQVSEISVPYGFPETRGSSDSSLFTQLSTPVQESSSCSSEEMVTGSASRREPSQNSDYSMCEVHVTGPADPIPRGSVYHQQLARRPESIYRMESEPRGLAVVINNESFDVMNPRPGSEVDMLRFQELFKMLGFWACYETNCTATRMRELLDGFSKYKKLEDMHSLIVAILSHGGRNGVIYGKDGRADSRGYAAKNTYLTDDDVRDYFSARRCLQMAGKPKLFIIQACRGNNEDLPVNPSVSASSGSNSSMHTEGSSLASSSTSSSSRRTADMADFCLIHSSASGYVSYRHNQGGSPFIATLTDIFKKYAATEHILDIMTEVTRELSNQSLTSDDRRTVPSTTHMLTKRWFLNPPSRPFTPPVEIQMKY